MADGSLTRRRIVTMHRLLALAALTGIALAGCAKEKENEAAEAATPAAASAATQPGAQSYAVEAPDSLRPYLKIDVDTAVSRVLARVPNGVIQKVELEREGGAV